MTRPEKPPLRAPSLRRRLALLAACMLAGSVVGIAAQHLWATSMGFLALPLFIVVAWLFVADPTQCTARARQLPHDDRPPQ